MQNYLTHRKNYKEIAQIRRQRNRLQMKEQENPSEELNERKASNLSDREFRVMITRIFNSMKKDIETINRGPVRNKECNI